MHHSCTTLTCGCTLVHLSCSPGEHPCTPAPPPRGARCGARARCTVQRVRTGDVTATTCPCGVELGPRQDKFCSREHAGRYTRGKRPTPSHCRACSWPMAEDNLYVSRRSDGRTVTRCRRCTLAR